MSACDFFPDLKTLGGFLAAALVAGGGGLAPAQSGPSELAQSELERRAGAAGEARKLIDEGDAAYADARFDEAAEAYRRAAASLPERAPAVAELRAAAVRRLAQAAVEVAREQRRLGDLEAAEQALDQAAEFAPRDLEIAEMREQLHDPIRTNPALTKEHAADVEEVRLLLYKADGAYELGKFDEAHAVYESVLRVDPTNSAARRGMEKVSEARADYARAAYDQTRAEMLSAVDGGWELQVPAPAGIDGGDRPGGQGGVAPYIDKLNTFRIPVIALDDISLTEGVDFLRQQSIALDENEPDPLNRGVNIVTDLGGPESEAAQRARSVRFDLNMRDVPLDKAIDFVAEATGTVAVREPFAVVFRARSDDSAKMVIKTYRVPPDFLSAGTGNDEAGGVDDPFAPRPEDRGLVAERLTAEEVLKKRGVSFPEGATASFNPSSSTLRVRNTVANHSVIDQLVEMLAGDEPTSVIVEVKMIRTTQKDLEELSFDWLLGEFGFGGSDGGVPGRSAAYLAGGTQGNGGALDDVIPGTGFERKPITSGNRSGEGAIGGNSIDGVLGGIDRGGQPLRAPGALWVNGLFNDTHLTMLMRGLDQKKGMDMLSAPTVVTRSGQAANVRVTRELIYPTEYEPPELPNQVGTGSALIDLDTGQVFGEELDAIPVTPATPTAFEMRETGVILEVLPTASEDKRYVDVTLVPRFTEFDGFINYGTPILAGQSSTILPGANIGNLFGQVSQVVTPNEILMPVFSRIETNTALTVADNSTIVIGGMLEERTERVNDKTPILGDIPVVGRLFQSKASQTTKTAIVMFVTVRVVDAAGRPFHP